MKTKKYNVEKLLKESERRVLNENEIYFLMQETGILDPRFWRRARRYAKAYLGVPMGGLTGKQPPQQRYEIRGNYIVGIAPDNLHSPAIPINDPSQALGILNDPTTTWSTADKKSIRKYLSQSISDYRWGKAGEYAGKVKRILQKPIDDLDDYIRDTYYGTNNNPRSQKVIQDQLDKQYPGLAQIRAHNLQMQQQDQQRRDSRRGITDRIYSRFFAPQTPGTSASQHFYQQYISPVAQRLSSIARNAAGKRPVYTAAWSDGDDAIRGSDRRTSETAQLKKYLKKFLESELAQVDQTRKNIEIIKQFLVKHPEATPETIASGKYISTDGNLGAYVTHLAQMATTGSSNVKLAKKRVDPTKDLVRVGTNPDGTPRYISKSEAKEHSRRRSHGLYRIPGLKDPVDFATLLQMARDYEAITSPRRGAYSSERTPVDELVSKATALQKHKEAQFATSAKDTYDSIMKQQQALEYLRQNANFGGGLFDRLFRGRYFKTRGQVHQGLINNAVEKLLGSKNAHLDANAVKALRTQMGNVLAKTWDGKDLDEFTLRQLESKGIIPSGTVKKLSDQKTAIFNHNAHVRGRVNKKVWTPYRFGQNDVVTKLFNGTYVSQTTPSASQRVKANRELKSERLARDAKTGNVVRNAVRDANGNVVRDAAGRIMVYTDTGNVGKYSSTTGSEYPTPTVTPTQQAWAAKHADARQQSYSTTDSLNKDMQAANTQGLITHYNSEVNGYVGYPSGRNPSDPNTPWYVFQPSTKQWMPTERPKHIGLSENYRGNKKSKVTSSKKRKTNERL